MGPHHRTDFPCSSCFCFFFFFTNSGGRQEGETPAKFHLCTPPRVVSAFLFGFIRERGVQATKARLRANGIYREEKGGKRRKSSRQASFEVSTYILGVDCTRFLHSLAQNLYTAFDHRPL